MALERSRTFAVSSGRLEKIFRKLLDALVEVLAKPQNLAD